MSPQSQIVVITGWILSILTLIATVIAVVIIHKRRREGDSNVSTWLGYTVGIYVTAFFMLLSQEIVGLAGSTGSPIILDTVLSCMQMLSTGRDISLDAEALAWMGPALPPYVIYNAALFVAAPVGTLGTILSLANNLFGIPVVRKMAESRDTYVISDLNEQSLELGKSIIEKGNSLGMKKLVVYANVDPSKSSLGSDARLIGARCLPHAIDYIAPRIWANKTCERAFVFASDDEVKNLGDGLELAGKVCVWSDEGLKAPHVLIFSSSPVAGPSVDAAAAKLNDASQGKLRVRIRRVDWIRSTIDTMLDSYPLFATGLDESCMTNEGASPKLRFDYDLDSRRILIVGKSEFPREFLKGALWAGQLGDKIKTHIDVVALGVDGFESRFKFECPEFFAKDGRPYQDHYSLRFHSINPESADFAAFLRGADEGNVRSGYDEFGEFTHVFIALENDLVCAKVARRTRELLEQRRLMNGPFNPAFIGAIINNAELADTVRNMKARERSYAIVPLGDDAFVYSYDNIFNPMLYRQAQNVNRIYNEYAIGGKSGAEFKAAVELADLGLANSEYNFRSSLASALHRKYALFLVCRDLNWKEVENAEFWTHPLEEVDKGALDLFENYINSGQAGWLSKLEHDRWSAYVSAEGHEYMPLDALPAMYQMENRHNYELAHLHPCLIDFEDLPNLDEAVRPYTEEETAFQKLDDNVVFGIPLIIASEEDFEKQWEEHFKKEL